MNDQLPASHRAVAYVAEKLYDAQPTPRWWQRRLARFDFVPLAREAVGVLFLLPEGRALVDEILAESEHLGGRE